MRSVAGSSCSAVYMSLKHVSSPPAIAAYSTFYSIWSKQCFIFYGSDAAVPECHECAKDFPTVPTASVMLCWTLIHNLIHARFLSSRAFFNISCVVSKPHMNPGHVHAPLLLRRNKYGCSLERWHF